jgi:hypothetical protein
MTPACPDIAFLVKCAEAANELDDKLACPCNAIRGDARHKGEDDAD